MTLPLTRYSPNYEDKALRLVRSCDRAGVCCKAVLLPSDAFGAGVTEDSPDPNPDPNPYPHPSPKPDPNRTPYPHPSPYPNPNQV